MKGETLVIDEKYRKRIEQGGVLIYLRKSRDLGDGEDVLSNHRMVLEQLCKKHGWSYVIKEEIASSDSIEYRKVFKEVLEKDIPSGLYSALVVYAQDRLTRKLGDNETIEETLKNHDVLLIDKNETVSDFSKYGDRLSSGFKSFIAKQEFEVIKERLKDGKKANAMKGKWVNGKAPFGYFYDKNIRKLIPDTTGNPSPAELVKSMYQDAIKGVSTSDIAYNFNRKGILSPKSSHWTSTTISRILRQEVYLGKTIYGKSSGSGHKNKKTTPLKLKEKDDWIIVNNAHEPLISEETFEEVQAQLSRRTKVIATRGKSKATALKGLVKCAQCGSGLHIQVKDNGKNLIKSCWYKNTLGEKCSNRGIRESIVVEKLLEQIKGYRDEIALALENGQESDSSKEATLKEIRDLQRDLKSVKVKQDKLDDFLEDGIYTKEKYLSRMEKLTIKEKDIESDLGLLKHQLKKQEATKDKDKLNMLDMTLTSLESIENEEHRNKILKSIISHVALKRLSHQDEGEIHVNFL